MQLRALSDSGTVVSNRWTGCEEVALINDEPICVLTMQSDRPVQADFQ